MHRIDHPTKAVDKHGAGKHGFAGGNPTTGTPATRFTPEWCDDIQENIVRAVEGAGIAPVKGDHTQLLAAIQQLIDAAKFGIPPLPDHVGAAADGDELAIVVGGVHKRISVAELFTNRASVDQVARDQNALTAARLMMTTSITTAALILGRQWELATDEWNEAGSSGGALVAATPNYLSSNAAGTQVFSYTGADQSWVVPAGVTSVTVKLWGAGGALGDRGTASGANYGGGGGYVTGTLAVTPGETLTLVVGQGGKVASATSSYGGGGAGNLAGSASGAGGGGRSAIRRSGTELATAGGGGGVSGWTSSFTRGGVGGGTTGGNGTDVNGGGTGGTQSAGGACLYPTGGGTSGTQFQGGIGQTSSGGGGGGGGGGYFGGGGGYDVSGGGGGSSYLGGLTAASTTSGSGYTSGGAADPDYAAGVGTGATTGSTAGGNGRIVVSYAAAANMTRVSPTVPVSATSTFANLHFLYRDDSGSAVLGTDFTVELSGDGGATYVPATFTVLAAFEGSYSFVRARANLGAVPTSLKARVKTLNTKSQRFALPALSAE